MDGQRGGRSASDERRSPEVAHADDVPVGVQLGWRLRAMIQSGRLEAGARLPGVREFGAGAGVNVNTARAVYRRLEQEDLVLSRQGAGTFVADHPRITPALEQVAAEAAEAAIALGVEPRELACTIYAASEADPFDKRPDPPELDAELSETEARAARRSLRAQIARLEGELASYPEVDPDAAAARRTYPSVPDLGDLEATRDELFRRLKRARASAERRGRRQGVARAHLERMVSDPGAHKRDVVSNQDLGEPGCTTWEVAPSFGPVGALMNWWRVKVSSGCPLPGP